MPDYITLLGAEQVEHAAREIVSAADKMVNAAAQMQFALEQHSIREDEREWRREKELKDGRNG